jgi:hypothetical protein
VGDARPAEQPDLVQLLKDAMNALRNKAATSKDRSELAARIQRELMEKGLWP